MTPADLAAIEALCEAATPGPWESDFDEDPSDNGIYTPCGCLIASVHPHANVRTNIATGQEFSHADARFIAASRTIVPQLVAEVRRIKAALVEANHWRERHSADAAAYGARSNENWNEANRLRSSVDRIRRAVGLSEGATLEDIETSVERIIETWRRPGG